jgi:hypothetical protein
MRQAAPVKPKPSLKRGEDGKSSGSFWRYAVHFNQPELGVLPLSSA